MPVGAKAPNWTVEQAGAHEGGAATSMGEAGRFARNATFGVLVNIAGQSIICPEMDKFCPPENGDITSR